MNLYHKLHQEYTAQHNERKMQSIAFWLQSRVYSVVNFPHMYLRKSERHSSAREKKQPHKPSVDKQSSQLLLNNETDWGQFLGF